MKKLLKDIRKSVSKFSKPRERSSMSLSRGKPLMLVGKEWKKMDLVVAEGLIVVQNLVTTSQRCQQGNKLEEPQMPLERKYQNGNYKVCSLDRQWDL